MLYMYIWYKSIQRDSGGGVRGGQCKVTGGEYRGTLRVDIDMHLPLIHAFLYDFIRSPMKDTSKIVV
jgi:hypothetical protein